MQPRILPGSESAINSWVDKQLTRYVKNEMATPEDPIRALAERGVLHVDPEQLNFRPEFHGRYLSPGQTAVAQSLPARTWEGVSDALISPNEAGIMRAIPGALEKNPWLEKLGSEDTVYGLTSSGRYGAEDLGFHHLIDELRNATNPTSGLPPELLLKYESLPKVSVPQAVERVAKINEWRAAQKAEADLARANNTATVLHKDYPEKGYKWVQLKQGDNLPEGWAEEFVDTELGKLRKFRDPKTGGLTATDPTEEALRDALKYEGDTMGHCVGGYCDDVASGKSNIYSLRDAKGRPHVTIETGAPRNLDDQQIPDKYMDEALDMLGGDHPGLDTEELNNLARELFTMENPNLTRIIQIKGKGNAKPADDYLPFVQDFVKSGKWSDVGDLQNTGMHKWGDRYLTPSEVDALSPDEADAFASRNVGRGYAHGGLVIPHAKIDQWLNELE